DLAWLGRRRWALLQGQGRARLAEDHGLHDTASTKRGVWKRGPVAGRREVDPCGQCPAACPVSWAKSQPSGSFRQPRQSRRGSGVWPALAASAAFTSRVSSGASDLLTLGARDALTGLRALYLDAAGALWPLSLWHDHGEDTVLEAGPHLFGIDRKR